MPKIHELRQTIKVNFVSVPEVEVEMLDSLILSEEEKMESLQGMEKSLVMLEFLITKWNLLDNDGQPLPITKENFRKLPSGDISHILNFLTEHIKKKNLQSGEKLIAPLPEVAAHTS